MAKNDKIKKILVMRPEHIGDYALSLRSLASIRHKYPEAKIDIVVGPWNKSLAEATPYVDDVIVFEHPLVKRHIGYKGILRVITHDVIVISKFIASLNKQHYDLYVNFSDRKYNRLLDRLIKSKKKILGIKKKYIGGREVPRIEDLLKSSGINTINDSLKLNFNKKDENIVSSVLSGNYTKRVLVHSITSLPEKDWPLKKWKELLKMISKNKNVELLLIGTENEKNQLESVKRYVKNKNIKNLSGKLSLTQLVLLLSKCDFIFGGDSGPVHLAEITKTPSFIIFGPTSSDRWGPEKNLGGFIKNIDIRKIAVRDVFSKLKKLI
ncbi:glycosyltransferase family 9 protein [archaeon]|nr:glycosyltransferase family 9 protein [archaeon]